MDHTKPADRSLFYIFVGLLVWLPLPKATVHPWALSIMVIGSLGLILGWVTLQLRNGFKTHNTVKHALPVIVLLALTQIWVFLTLNGHIFNLDTATATLDTGRTRHQLLQGLGLLGIFSCTLLLVRSRRRIKIVIFTLIISGIV